MRKIKVKILPSGRVEIETEGFKGKACLDATREVEKLLGIVVDEKKKPEYFGQAVKTALERERSTTPD